VLQAAAADENGVTLETGVGENSLLHLIGLGEY